MSWEARNYSTSGKPPEFTPEQQADIAAFTAALRSVLGNNPLIWDPSTDLHVPTFFAHARWWQVALTPSTLDQIHAAAPQLQPDELPHMHHANDLRELLDFVRAHRPPSYSGDRLPSVPMRSEDGQRYWLLVLRRAAPVVSPN